MSDQVTRCPNCLVAFKVSQAQLQAANGLARCGACLTIFDARQQLTELPETLANKASVATADSGAEDDFLIDDHFDPDNLDENAAPSPDHSVADTSPPRVGPDQQSTRETDAPPATFSPLPETLHLPLWLQDARQPAETTREESLTLADKDTSADSDGAHPGEFVSDSAADSPPPPTAEYADDADEGTEDPYADLGATAAVQFDNDETHSRMAVKADVRLSPRLLTTGILSLGALALLVQYIYFNVDVLGKQVTHRPWLEKFCRVTQCDLPILKDNSLIRSSDLVVRTHPGAAGALLVSAVLVNDAPFQQPFPTLQLVFQDLQGAVVAKRSFVPDEYVRGELTGARRMPVRQPVRLELEILDPGQTAVSFALYIL